MSDPAFIARMARRFATVVIEDSDLNTDAKTADQHIEALAEVLLRGATHYLTAALSGQPGKPSGGRGRHSGTSGSGEGY
jgi:hypothetical protein